MTLALAAALALAASPLAAQELTAEQAMENYRAMTAVDVAADCRRDAGPDEIVVCGRDDSARQRLPFPSESGPRDGPRRATGEIAAASAAPMRSDSCGMRSTDECIGGLSIFQVAGVLFNVARKLIDPEAEIEPPTPIPGKR
ncbi:MAG: hypothetical protein IAG13_20755 [Deltaproteobacteria bacterium]|nr:hypothetical protein [Nannocystaceae bacterium]